jgi:hypothetical protein
MSLLSSGFLCADLLRADEVRLKDGRVLVGKVKISGKSLQVQTREKSLRLSMSEVEGIRSEAELREELRGLAERSPRDSAHSQLELARQAQAWALKPELWQHLDLALRLSEAQDKNQERLRSFLGELERDILPRRLRHASPKTRVRELLFRVRPTQPTSLRAAVVEILARMEDAADPLRRKARTASSSMQRLAAVEAIAKRQEGNGKPFMYRTAILDRSAAVRRDVMSKAASQGDSLEAIQYLAPGLGHDSPMVRMRTADAFANLQDSSLEEGAAIDLLVTAGPLAAAGPLPGGSTRAHVAITSQEAYVRDYDVEIAQSAFVADPIVDVLSSGVVLDATVHAVVSVRTQVVDSYRRALTRLTGDDPGPRTASWSEWLQQRRGF